MSYSQFKLTFFSAKEPHYLVVVVGGGGVGQPEIIGDVRRVRDRTLRTLIILQTSPPERNPTAM